MVKLHGRGARMSASKGERLERASASMMEQGVSLGSFINRRPGDSGTVADGGALLMMMCTIDDDDDDEQCTVLHYSPIVHYCRV